MPLGGEVGVLPSGSEEVYGCVRSMVNEPWSTCWVRKASVAFEGGRAVEMAQTILCLNWPFGGTVKARKVCAWFCCGKWNEKMNVEGLAPEHGSLPTQWSMGGIQRC